MGRRRQRSLVVEGIVLSVSMIAAMVLQGQLIGAFVQIFHVAPDAGLMSWMQPLIGFEAILVVVGIGMVVFGLGSRR